jgi:hypothetical protein
MIDLKNLSDAALARWARVRIKQDCDATVAQINAAVEDAGKFDIGINLEHGVVMFRDEHDSIHVLAPSHRLIVQTADDREAMYEDGRELYDVPNPGAVT